VDRHRQAYGVESICKVLQIAPSGFWRHAALTREPHKRCARAQRDEALMPHIQRVWHTNLQVYGADKVWKQMNREGLPVARCTVERLMRRLGLRGVRRGRVVRTTIGDKKTPCPLDRVNRQFSAERPNQLWVSDFTYVSTWQGWLYVAFVIDVFARRIVGWRVSSTMRTDFVLDALEQALYARQPERDGTLVCHSDRGAQYVSIRYTERLAEAGIEPSVGSKGDGYDNALAETINGLYKAELIHRRAPWKTRESVELATLEWVSWFNHHRLLEPIAYIPPAEAEANYYRQLASQAATPA
jgi:putative transposase